MRIQDTWGYKLYLVASVASILFCLYGITQGGRALWLSLAAGICGFILASTWHRIDTSGVRRLQYMTGTVKLVTIRKAGSLREMTVLMNQIELEKLKAYGTDYLYVKDEPADTITADEVVHDERLRD